MFQAMQPSPATHVGREAVILMSAVVPTTGHRDLIRFGLNLPVEQVTVLLGSLPGEPVDPEERRDALLEAVGAYGDAHLGRLRIIILDESDAPNHVLKAKDVNLFFTLWADLIRETVGVADTGRDLCLVGSEPYCLPQAEALGVPYIPYDQQRHLNQTQGRKVRASMASSWTLLTAGMRRKFGVTVTLVGGDCGMRAGFASRLARAPLAETVAAYAGQYLATVGAELTEEKLATVWAGQAAWQRMAGDRDRVPLLVQDTDLFTVVNQYRAEGWKVPEGLVADAVGRVSDAYFVLPGREDDGWLAVAEQYGLRVVQVPEGTETMQVRFIQDVMFRLFNEKVAPVEQFKRTNIDPDPVVGAPAPATVAV